MDIRYRLVAEKWAAPTVNDDPQNAYGNKGELLKYVEAKEKYDQLTANRTYNVDYFKSGLCEKLNYDTLEINNEMGYSYPYQCYIMMRNHYTLHFVDYNKPLDEGPPPARSTTMWSMSRVASSTRTRRSTT